MLINLMFRS